MIRFLAEVDQKLIMTLFLPMMFIPTEAVPVIDTKTLNSTSDHTLSHTKQDGSVSMQVGSTHICWTIGRRHRAMVVANADTMLQAKQN